MALAWGPNSKTTSWNIYFVNGYKFHTKAWSDGKKITNCGLYVKGVTDGGEDDFYGIIDHIFEFKYVGLTKKIPLFYCEWFDPTFDVGTTFLSQYSILEIKLNGRYAPYDPFILPQKAIQVYYVLYPTICKNLRCWCVAIKTKPRGHIEVDKMEDELPYQANEIPNVLPVTRIKHLQGLAETFVVEVLDHHDMEPLDQSDQELSNEDDEENDNNDQDGLESNKNDD